MAMLAILFAKAKKNMESTKKKIVSERPIRNRNMGKKTNPHSSGHLLSNLSTSQPDIGRPMNELTGKVRRMLPSSASFNPKWVFIVGILEAQLEKQSPKTKK
jgi:hypothetical protein